uniref:Sperm microtubule inner protein 1 C-terminal domain-containing protein n=1 Tax=Eutreptiella gymnastica TaxID=73025 RepID=A0A7S4LL02_9EUGL|eukprot:CAMPEP_0174286864 /NCGR_PEP_ID=MMETSP0809-20121228/13449_1 /TAXON_ID=73025 ORGANISM="Eutreptiella gymnastica-like, Strain CCMP1594" /NCGR_SAMPLE_ID=MMETSP0809 /ASSEMBLY_ACC=CAM_ASM_000658 /LENGTH=159 /DNA_ID=CAMNT_0015383113 /DNA_START=79 /DNA_END=558 /DNA_ORIENTATION=-
MGEKPQPKGYTDAMGLNQTAASIEGYKQLILKEELARQEWRHQYEASGKEAEQDILDRVRNQPSEILPRSSALQETLRDGISKEGKGRSAFLQARRHENPQTKFRRPQTESQRIGWTCTTLPPPSEHATHYGRKPIISNNFYRKTGVFGPSDNSVNMVH